MTLRKALREAGRAARANLLPGLLLQTLMVIFFLAYLSHEGTRNFLARVADLKAEVGYVFAFVSYAIAAALLPEVLRIGFFQECRITRRNLWNIVTGIPIWGWVGIMVDMLYRGQESWFGAGNAWPVILAKMAVDQFLFSPLIANPFSAGTLAWRDAGFRRSALPGILSLDFVYRRLIPLQVAGWCIWIPGVCLVYFMPSLLQVPVAVLIQVFWVLIFTTLGERSRHGSTHALRSAGPDSSL